MSRRWRPSLALVLGGALAGTLGLSFLGLVAFRYLGPEIGFRNAAYVLAALIGLATAALGWLLVRLLLRPVRALEHYAALVRQDPSLAGRPPAHFGTRETHATAQSVIEMATALRDRAATVRSFTDHVTHEIKTPVSAIRAAVELMEDGGALGPVDARLLREVAGATVQIEAQLAALRAVAQARETRYLGAEWLGDLAEPLAERHLGLAIEIEGDDLALPMSREGLLIVLGHLLGNAREAGATRVRLLAEATPEAVSLTVADDGPGISEGNRAHLFEPFFTTRRTQGGSGMGLAIVRATLAAHGAEITDLPGGTGARFRLRFATPVRLAPPGPPGP